MTEPDMLNTEGIVPGSVYRISNKSCPRKSVELYFGSSAMNTPVHIWDTVEDEHFYRQLWVVKPVMIEGKRAYAFRNLRSGTQMELFEGGARNGTHVHGQPDRRPVPVQGLWLILPAVEGYWRVKNNASHTYLALSHGGLSNGRILECWEYAEDKPTQLWAFERMSRNFHHYLSDDHKYLIPPKTVIEKVWARTGVNHIAHEPGVFGSDSSAIGFKSALYRAILDFPVREEDLGIMCGIVFAERPVDNDTRALNWFVLMDEESGCTEILFFGPGTGTWDRNAFGYTKLCFGLC